MIFGIGLSKTGTHSLTRALELLGLRAIHYPDPAGMVAGRFREVLAGYDAATDISVSACFRELDRAFPGSRFILTLREIDQWIESVADHRRRRDHLPIAPDCPKAIIRERVYGVRTFDEEAFRRAYARHRREVRDYFACRPDDLLEIDLCAAPSWDRLCAFLGRPVPDIPFPHLNARRRSA